MEILLLSFLSISLRLRRKLSLCHALFDELFVLGIFSLLFAPLPQILVKPIAALLFFLILIHDALLRRFNLELRWELFPYLVRPGIYLRSAGEFKGELSRLALLFALGVVLLAAMPKTPYWPGFFLLPLGWVRTPKEHFFLLFFKDLMGKKREGKVRPFSFPKEETRGFSSTYPLLRLTNRFHGEKRFHVRIDPEEKPHVLFCFLESFRIKSLSFAPNFQKLIQEGIFFSEFYANSNQTNTALVSSLFGIPPSLKVSYQLNRYAGLPLIGLPKIFKQAGYRTALIQGAQMEPSIFPKLHGFDTAMDKLELLREDPHLPCMRWGIHDEAVFRKSANWLSEQKTSVFLTLFTVSNHHPWTLPMHWEPPKKAKGNPYLETYSYTDFALGEWINQLNERNLLDRSILFLLGDHGQGLGEHGNQCIVRNSLYEEDLRVPLLIYAPGRIAKPVVIEEPCSQIDLLPTVLDLFHLTGPHHSLGHSLLRKKKRFLYFYHALAVNGETLACRLGRWKAIWAKTKEELFDLKQDPEETVNLSSLYPRRMKRLKAMMERYSHSLETLYQRKAFAPPTHEIHCSPPKGINDRQLRRLLKKKQDLYSLNLSKCTRITGKDIALPTLRQLNLSGTMRIDIPSLASRHPKLTSLNLSHCLLLRDSLLKEVLKNCKELQELNLEGVQDLQSIASEPLASLDALNLLECPHLDGSWADWISLLPNLKNLKICCLGWKEEDFRKLKGDGWDKLHLSGCRHLEGKFILDLRENISSLRVLLLEDSPLSDPELRELCEKGKSKSAIVKIQNKVSSVIFGGAWL